MSRVFLLRGGIVKSHVNQPRYHLNSTSTLYIFAFIGFSIAPFATLNTLLRNREYIPRSWYSKTPNLALVKLESEIPISQCVKTSPDFPKCQIASRASWIKGRAAMSPEPCSIQWVEIAR